MMPPITTKFDDLMFRFATGKATESDLPQLAQHAVRMRQALMPLLSISMIIPGGFEIRSPERLYKVTAEELQAAVVAIDIPTQIPDWNSVNYAESARILKKMEAEKDSFTSDKVWRKVDDEPA